MNSKISKIVIVLVLIIPFLLWLNKAINYIESDQKNDRVNISNAVVYIINEIQSKIHSHEAFFERFLNLDELNESQQRGTYLLLEITEYDDREDIELAQIRLTELFLEMSPEDKVLLIPARNLINSYSGYATVYKEITEIIQSKSLSNVQLELFLAERYQQLAMMSAQDSIDFNTAHQSYIQSQ